MTVFVSIGLSAGMPIIIIAAFFGLLFKYLYLKYLFVRFCKIPKTYDEALDLKVVGLLPYCILLHFMLGIWMFGTTTIFSSDSSDFANWVNNLNYSFIQQIGFLISRMLSTWYYSLFFIAVALLFTFKLIIFNLVVKNFVEDSKEIDVIQVKGQGGD